LLVAIDGPAGAGKSTVARAVARELGFTYLDSGAMYRCVALLSLAAPAREPAELANAARIEFRDRSGNTAGAGNAAATGNAAGAGVAAAAGDSADGAARTLLNGRDVSGEIRTSEVSQAASRVARDPGVRAALVTKQRALIAAGDWVAEGRDIGTVVAPDAALKVYLTASPQERARRRAAESGGDPADVLAEQSLRDERDSTRRHSPLRPAPGAVTLDTTGIELGQVVARIAKLARERATSS
jgi:cytidylate kinase